MGKVLGNGCEVGGWRGCDVLSCVVSEVSQGKNDALLAVAGGSRSSPVRITRTWKQKNGFETLRGGAEKLGTPIFFRAVSSSVCIIIL